MKTISTSRARKRQLSHENQENHQLMSHLAKGLWSCLWTWQDILGGSRSFFRNVTVTFALWNLSWHARLPRSQSAGRRQSNRLSSMHVSKGQGAKWRAWQGLFAFRKKKVCYITSCILKQIFQKIRVSWIAEPFHAYFQL